MTWTQVSYGAVLLEYELGVEKNFPGADGVWMWFSINGVLTEATANTDNSQMVPR